mmetsp:Transcript_23086/g.35958  ORF Transcript_23086/g.35958 Transcript_23086/m.35958 type:complete len:293 (+) Transcript_23086:52-930(+)
MGSIFSVEVRLDSLSDVLEGLVRQVWFNTLRDPVAGGDILRRSTFDLGFKCHQVFQPEILFRKFGVLRYQLNGQVDFLLEVLQVSSRQHGNFLIKQVSETFVVWVFIELSACEECRGILRIFWESELPVEQHLQKPVFIFLNHQLFLEIFFERNLAEFVEVQPHRIVFLKQLRRILEHTDLAILQTCKLWIRDGADELEESMHSVCPNEDADNLRVAVYVEVHVVCRMMFLDEGHDAVLIEHVEMCLDIMDAICCWNFGDTNTHRAHQFPFTHHVIAPLACKEVALEPFVEG